MVMVELPNSTKSISEWKIKRVRNVMAECCQFGSQSPWQLRIHHELHAAIGSMRLTRLR